jgi:hypothetical protein
LEVPESQDVAKEDGSRTKAGPIKTIAMIVTKGDTYPQISTKLPRARHVTEVLHQETELRHARNVLQEDIRVKTSPASGQHALLVLAAITIRRVANLRALHVMQGNSVVEGNQLAKNAHLENLGHRIRHLVRHAHLENSVKKKARTHHCLVCLVHEDKIAQSKARPHVSAVHVEDTRRGLEQQSALCAVLANLLTQLDLMHVICVLLEEISSKILKMHKTMTTQRIAKYVPNLPSMIDRVWVFHATHVQQQEKEALLHAVGVARECS